MNVNFLSTPGVQLVAGLIIVTLLFDFLLRSILPRVAARLCGDRGESSPHGWRGIAKLAVGPISLLVWFYGLYAVARIAFSDWLPTSWNWSRQFLNSIAGLGAFVAVTWFCFRATRLLDQYLGQMAKKTPGTLEGVLLPLLGSGMRIFVPIIAGFFLVRLCPLPPESVAVVRKLLAMVMIVSVAWLLRNAVLLTERAVLTEKDLQAKDFEQRALFTRVSVLRKIVLVLISVFSLSAVLMLFDEVRDVGRSILASAGIAGIILGFAAQRSLGTLFAGLQIALTQPIRIGDQISVEGEVGNIEEITLTYVVVRIWDLRRLVLPISYFIEKPIQNWTRASTNLLSPVVLRTDYTFPIAPFRIFMQDLIKTIPEWDGEVFGVQVTSADQYSMEVRILGSAADAGASFNLQCALREKAIDYIHRLYPQCFPKSREEGKPILAWKVSEEFGPRQLDAATLAGAKVTKALAQGEPDGGVGGPKVEHKPDLPPQIG